MSNFIGAFFERHRLETENRLQALENRVAALEMKNTERERVEAAAPTVSPFQSFDHPQQG